MTYKGFELGKIKQDEQGFSAEVLDIDDLVIVQGATTKELENDFHESIDFYLEEELSEEGILRIIKASNNNELIDLDSDEDFEKFIRETGE